MKGDRGWMSLVTSAAKFVSTREHICTVISSHHDEKGYGRSDRLPALARLKSASHIPKTRSTTPATSSSGPRPELRSTASRSRSLIRRRSSSPRPFSCALAELSLANDLLVASGDTSKRPSLLSAASMRWSILQRTASQGRSKFTTQSIARVRAQVCEFCRWIDGHTRLCACVRAEELRVRVRVLGCDLCVRAYVRSTHVSTCVHAREFTFRVREYLFGRDLYGFKRQSGQP